LLHTEFSAVDCTLNIVSKCRFFFIFKHSRAPKRLWKIFRGGRGKSWKSPGFFVSKRLGTQKSTWCSYFQVAQHRVQWVRVQVTMVWVRVTRVRVLENKNSTTLPNSHTSYLNFDVFNGTRYCLLEHSFENYRHPARWRCDLMYLG